MWKLPSKRASNGSGATNASLLTPGRGGGARLLLAFMLVLGAGCGGGGGDGGGEEPAAGADGGGAAATGGGTGAGFGTASVSGTVMFDGEAPAPQPIKMDADPYCTVQHADGATVQKFVVGQGGGLKWVFVYVKDGLTAEYEPPSTPVVLNQKGCAYEPHVFGIMAGQALSILNSDETLHNIHSLPKNSREFNLAMPRAGMKLEQQFRRPEVPVRIKCDVHPWMESFAGVLSNPFHSVTGDDGTFSLEKLPAGTYTIAAWHEGAEEQTQTVTVGDGEAKQVTFTFSES